MKPVIILAFACSISAVKAQTPLISHKSHAGSSASYLIASSSNFGQIRMDFDRSFQQPKLYKAEYFKPLNDSVIILEIKDIEQHVISTDTFPNKEKYSPVLFQARYNDSIRKKELEENYKRELEQEEQLQKQQQESQQQLNEPVPAKKKKKSYLLFLFGITGGGMLLMRLFSKSRIRSSIA